jgi:hypothetical protein
MHGGLPAGGINEGQRLLAVLELELVDDGGFEVGEHDRRRPADRSRYLAHGRLGKSRRHLPSNALGDAIFHQTGSLIMILRRQGR